MRYLLIILLSFTACNKPKTVYLYNAYSPVYDEYYIVKSNIELTNGQLFNDVGDTITILNEYKTEAK